MGASRWGSDATRVAHPNLLLLVDGRLPDGSYAHSGGLEAVAGLGLVTDIASLQAFLQGRLETVGLTAAALAAVAATGASTAATNEPAPNHLPRPKRPHRAGDTVARSSGAGSLRALDALADARMPSSAAREASRRQGRNLVRAASRAWPSSAYGDLPDRPHHPVALGVVAGAAGLSSHDASLAAAYGSVTGPAGAAVRLLSLDPLTVQALLANLADDIQRIAAQGLAAIESGTIPAFAAPLVEIGAEHHATWEVRLFAS